MTPNPAHRASIAERRHADIMPISNLISSLRARKSSSDPPGAIDLLVVAGADTGQRFTISASEVAISGTPRNGDSKSKSDSRSVYLHDTSVSACQAVIYHVDGRFEIEHDKRARHATRVNGAEVLRAPLAAGDRVEIGSVILEVREPPAAASGIFEIAESKIETAAPALELEFALHVIRGAVKQIHPLLEGETSIGRGEDCSLRFALELSISRLHARVERTGNRIVLHHLSGINETRVNGVELTASRTLRSGDEIELANCIALRFKQAGHADLNTLPQRMPEPGNLVGEMTELMEQRQRIEEQFAVDGSFVDIDIAGSRLLKRGIGEPERIVISFERWRDWVADEIKDQQGEVLNTNGDELMALFEDPDDALLAATAILANLPRFNREQSLLNEPFRLRIGIHSGRALVDRERGIAYSAVLDLAGHLQKCSQTDGILISRVTRDQLKSEPPGITSFEPADPVDGVDTYRIVLAPSAGSRAIV